MIHSCLLSFVLEMTLHKPVSGNSPEGCTIFQQQVAIDCTVCCQIGTDGLAEA